MAEDKTSQPSISQAADAGSGASAPAQFNDSSTSTRLKMFPPPNMKLHLEENTDTVTHKPLSISQPIKKAISVNLKQLIREDIENIKGQVLNFFEINNKISGRIWGAIDIIDSLYVFVKSLNYDAVSVLFISRDNPAVFDTMISRGYSNPPDNNFVSGWKECICPEVPTIDWELLMEMVSSRQTDYARWLERENIYRIGYSPVHDGMKILGFIITASYDFKEPSPVASTLIELCGGTLGLSMELSKARTAGMKGMLDSLSAIRQRFTIIQGNMELLNTLGDSGGPKIPELTQTCLKNISEAMHTLDFISGKDSSGGGKTVPAV
jgi:hypothetical protein